MDRAEPRFGQRIGLDWFRVEYGERGRIVQYGWIRVGGFRFWVIRFGWVRFREFGVGGFWIRGIGFGIFGYQRFWFIRFE